MSWRAQEECEQRQWDEEAYHLSLDADKAYTAWLAYESARIRAEIESMERQYGN